MALDADNVVVAITGAVYAAPLGTTAPTDYATALNAAFKDLGYLGEDGVSITPNEASKKLKAWQNGQTVKTIRKGEDITVAFELIELRSEDAQKAYWGEGATVASGGLTVTVTDLSGSTPIMLVVEAHDGDVGTRYFFPKATLSERGTISLLSDNYQAMPVTFECAKDGFFSKVWHST
jgi:hypothetical protein